VRAVDGRCRRRAIQCLGGAMGRRKQPAANVAPEPWATGSTRSWRKGVAVAVSVAVGQLPEGVGTIPTKSRTVLRLGWWCRPSWLAAREHARRIDGGRLRQGGLVDPGVYADWGAQIIAQCCPEQRAHSHAVSYGRGDHGGALAARQPAGNRGRAPIHASPSCGDRGVNSKRHRPTDRRNRFARCPYVARTGKSDQATAVRTSCSAEKGAG
jgi:hypothetical protein